MYIYIYIHIYIYIYMYIYIYIYVYVYDPEASGREAQEAGEASGGRPGPGAEAAGGSATTLGKGQLGSALMGSLQASCFLTGFVWDSR